MKIVRCKDVKVMENKGNTYIYSNIEKNCGLVDLLFYFLFTVLRLSKC